MIISGFFAKTILQTILNYPELCKNLNTELIDHPIKENPISPSLLNDQNISILVPNGKDKCHYNRSIIIFKHSDWSLLFSKMKLIVNYSDNKFGDRQR